MAARSYKRADLRILVIFVAVDTPRPAVLTAPAPKVPLTCLARARKRRLCGVLTAAILATGLLFAQVATHGDQAFRYHFRAKMRAVATEVVRQRRVASGGVVMSRKLVDPRHVVTRVGPPRYGSLASAAREGGDAMQASIERKTVLVTINEDVEAGWMFIHPDASTAEIRAALGLIDAAGYEELDSLETGDDPAVDEEGRTMVPLVKKWVE